MFTSPQSYLFTSATVRIPVHTTPKSGTEPIRHVTLHFVHRRGAAALRYRNYSTKITVLVREQKLHPIWFRACARAIRYRVFSHDVTAAILVFQNNETAAMLVSQTNPLGVELFSYANTFFCSNKFA